MKTERHVRTIFNGEAHEVDRQAHQVTVFRSVATGNVFGPSSAGNDDLTGDYNTAIGENAMDAVTSGSDSIAIGRDSLTDMTTGGRNNAQGSFSGNGITDGVDNIILGDNALKVITSPNRNIVIGNTAVNSAAAGDTIDDNVMIGYGICNFAVEAAITDNVIIGSGAGANVDQGSESVIIGKDALAGDSFFGGNTTKNIAIGYRAAFGLRTGEENVIIGHGAAKSVVDPDGSVIIGSGAFATSTTDINDSVVIGKDTITNATAASIITECVFIGYRAGADINNGMDSTVAIGAYALENVGGGADGENVAVGFRSGREQTTGFYNTFLGPHSGENLTTGSRNTFLGAWAGQAGVITGAQNVAIGMEALQALTGGGQNVVAGYQAGEDITSGSRNVVIGRGGGAGLTTGTDNIIIGDSAGDGATGNTTDMLYIHNVVGTPLIGGDMANLRVGINVDPTALSNILEVEQTSATDPIADNWTTYPCDRNHKDILGEAGNLLQQFARVPVYRVRRKKLKPGLEDSAKFQKVAYGISTDDDAIPEEILVDAKDGKGIDILSYIGYLHGVLREAVQEIEKLKVT